MLGNTLGTKKIQHYCYLVLSNIENIVKFGPTNLSRFYLWIKINKLLLKLKITIVELFGLL
jgi:hypothetical protein